MRKAKIAFFDFTDCEGCQLQIVNLNTALVDLLNHIEIVNFREAMSAPADDYEVAVIEGSVSTGHDLKRLSEIAQRAKIVVALGACATIGGINGMKNLSPLETVKTLPVKPIDRAIKVDYYIHGCPVNLNEVAEVFKCILLHKKYKVPNYPVCVECKMNENVCMYEKEQNCLGPVTRGGCGAWCLNSNNICYGCRGLLNNPAVDAQKEILDKYGLKVEEVLNKFSLYCVCQEEKYAPYIKK